MVSRIPYHGGIVYTCITDQPFGGTVCPVYVPRSDIVRRRESRQPSADPAAEIFESPQVMMTQLMSDI